MESPILPDQQRRPNFFSRMLRRLSPQPPIQASLQAQEKTIGTPTDFTEPEIKMAETEVPKAEERQLNIGTHFIEILKEKGAIIPGEEKFENVGVSSIRSTNEDLDSSLIEKVLSQKEAPDGYLIGIGAGNVVTMLKLFPQGKIPKAMILFDIDPEVVYEGKKAIERLRDRPDEKYYDFWSGKSIAAFYPNAMGPELESMLKQLAREGNLVIEQADFTDNRTIAALNELPNLPNYNNVVYLSNISDHVFRRNLKKGNENIPDFNYLKNLVPPKDPHRNYYVDTTQSSLAYNLRIGTRVPQLDQEDFKFRTTPIGKRSPTKPLDQIE